MAGRWYRTYLLLAIGLALGCGTSASSPEDGVPEDGASSTSFLDSSSGETNGCPAGGTPTETDDGGVLEACPCTLPEDPSGSPCDTVGRACRYVPNACWIISCVCRAADGGATWSCAQLMC
jgi:hypothetical protein